LVSWLIEEVALYLGYFSLKPSAMKKFLLFMSLLAFIFNGCSQSKSAEILNKKEFAKGIAQKNVRVIDVRTPEEYQAGHIDNAENIDYYDQENFKKAFMEFDKDDPIYIYCRSGGRSQKAGEILKQLGFTNLYDLEGGYLNWIKQQ